MKIAVAIALTVFAASGLRGQSGTLPPLCIIDGVRLPVNGCPEVLKQASRMDIESIEVVKGPYAASTYGPEGANGVILIRTKNGKAAADDPLARFLFPPELVMAHQQEVGLTDQQRRTIQGAMKEAQDRFVDLQFQMKGEVEKLQRLVQVPTADEIKVMEQLDRVLASEREVKRAQLALMIRIKNQLTEQQQAALTRLR
jgi:TonB-dependent SusC/RagA subfamily outer membrane receptor